MTEAEQAAWVADQLDRCAPFLQRALDLTDGTCDMAHVRTEVLEGRAQLWPAQHSALVTKIDLAPTGIKSLSLWLAGGEMAEVAGLEKAASAWGRKMGCTRAIIVGRRGWLRVLDGFREGQTILTKDL